MKNQYGAEEGEKIFYASKNAGKITGVDAMPSYGHPVVEIAKRLDAVAMRFDAYVQRRADELKQDEDEDCEEEMEEEWHHRKDQEGNAHEELRKGALSKDCT